MARVGLQQRTLKKETSRISTKPDAFHKCGVVKAMPTAQRTVALTTVLSVSMDSLVYHDLGFMSTQLNKQDKGLQTMVEQVSVALELL